MAREQGRTEAASISHITLWIFSEIPNKITNTNNHLYFHHHVIGYDGRFLSRVNMQSMYSAIFSYQFRLSVCPMPVLYPYEWTYHIFDILVGASFWFFSTIAVTKFQGKPLSRALNTREVEKFGKHRSLSRKMYEICPQLLWNATRK